MKKYTVIACGLVVAYANTMALNTELTVDNPAKIERRSEVVSTGVPFARGAVKDLSKLSVKMNGRPIPAQFVKTVAWPDGSVRWALLDTLVNVAAAGRTKLVVSDRRGPTSKPRQPVLVKDEPDAVHISTGPLQFTISKKAFNLFTSLKVDRRELLTKEGKGIVLVLPDGKEVSAGPPESIMFENRGPMRVTVCVHGKFPGVHHNLLEYTVRITAYAGQKFLKVHTWLENQGGHYKRAPGRSKWLPFDGLELNLGLNLGKSTTAYFEETKCPGDFVLKQQCPGHNWKGFKYTFRSLASGEGKPPLKEGARTGGTVGISGAKGKVTVAVRYFWENYEKSIELKEGHLRVWLWPRDGEWPRSGVSRGADRKEYPQYRKPGLYHLPGGVHKGHEIILDFSGRTLKATRAILASPLMAMASPAYIAGTEAAPGWFAPADFLTGKPEYDKRLKNWNQCALTGIDLNLKNRGSLYHARRGGADQRGYWYGWMDFGDNLWACGYSSLHYDWTWIMLLNYLRAGQRGFLDMGTTMARHRIDVDQIWTDKDSKFYSNLCRYEKSWTSVHSGLKDGYYGPIPSHTWLSGMVLYYMLTGENKARECAINCGRGIRRRQVAKYRNKPSAGGQTRSSGWAILALCSLYDMTADKTYLDDAMVLFNNNITPQWKQMGPYLQKGLQYYYTTQALCELHDRTGDENVMKLLEEGCAGSFSHKYKEWQIFLSNIYAYVGYKKNNPAYIKKAEDLFNAYIPAASAPPCYDGSGAWDKQSGKILRNGHILQFVEWKLKHAGK